MKKLLSLVIFTILLTNSAIAKHINSEKYYQNKWCSSNNGVQEYVLDDGARVDCLTKDMAIEFDFASKWAESIGQSLYYANKTNRIPAVVLIMENPNSEQRYYKRLLNVADKYGIRVYAMTNK